MSDFDYKDYAVRQFRIWATILGSCTIIIVLGLVARYGDIQDHNVQKLIVFVTLATSTIFLVGIYVSFIAWVEKKLFQYKKKIDKE